MEKPEELKIQREQPCAKEGDKINRNPLLGPTNQNCCPELTEIRVSKSYSICEKETIREKQALPPEPREQLPTDYSRKCGWCGGVCTKYPLPEGQLCPEIAPAPGYQCIEENGQCVAKYVKEETREGVVCAQVLTYKKSGDQCYLCPDACSPIEKCEIAPPEKCQESYIREGMPSLPAREESPFQFFKETISNIQKPCQQQ